MTALKVRFPLETSKTNADKPCIDIGIDGSDRARTLSSA